MCPDTIFGFSFAQVTAAKTTRPLQGISAVALSHFSLVWQGIRSRHGIGAGFFWKTATFFCKTQDFPANSSKHTEKFQGTSHLSSCTSDRDLSYPRNVLILNTTRRFGGFGAPEGRKKVPDHLFLQIKKNCVCGGRLWNQPDFSAKMCFRWKITEFGCN